MSEQNKIELFRCICEVVGFDDIPYPSSIEQLTSSPAGQPTSISAHVCVCVCACMCVCVCVSESVGANKKVNMIGIAN